MKRIIAILVLFQTFISCAQEVNVNDEIKKDFTEYSKLISESKVDEAMNYIYPKLFEMLPKDQFAGALKSMYSLPNMKFKMGMPSYSKFDKLVKIENENYVKLYVLLPLEFKFTDAESDKNNEYNSMMMNIFKSKYGEANVAFDEESGYIKVNAEKTVVAICDGKLLDWKFVEVDKPYLLKNIIPKEILGE